MTERAPLSKSFLDASGWGTAVRTQLAGDASNRVYDRLIRDDGTSAVLMDAPPERGEDVRPFVKIADHLAGLGLSAPEILAKDEANGFLLIEDLGDALFARLLEDQPELETPIYSAAIGVLRDLHRADAPVWLTAYDTEMMVDLALLAVDWYAIGSDHPTSDEQKAQFVDELSTAIRALAAYKPVLAQRDYHAENLLWLPDREGSARVGLLDFQDAVAGHPAYDLVSLLEDARRDVPEDLRNDMLALYINMAGANGAEFRYAYAVMGAQRNLRILGVFARLSLHFSKAHYVDLIPRVWDNLLIDLDHPALAALRKSVLATLPAPSPDVLDLLRLKCGTIQTL